MGEHLLTSFSSEVCTTTSSYENDTPQEVDVNCEIHCEYHHSYLPPKYNTFTILNASNSLEVFANNSYIFQMNLKISKPPIT